MHKRFQTTWLFVSHIRGHTRRIRWFWIPVFMIGLCLVTIPMYWAIKSYYLTHERQNILAELDKLESHKLRIVNQLGTLIVREENARIIAGLKEIHPDVRKVGVGGTLSSLKSAVDLKPLHVRTLQLSDEISTLQRETDLSITSLKDIEQRVREIKTYWRGVPSTVPVTGVMTSRFGLRKDPFTHLYRMHNGIDIAAPSGAPVKATADGIIIQTGLDVRYGRFVDIDHQNGMTTRFGHLSAILVNTDMKISRGDIIGRVGMTGRANGYHLHYEIRINNRRVNPEQYLEPESVVATDHPR